MKPTRRILSWLLVLVLSLGMFLPFPASASTIYLTAINDNIPALSANTMPIWSGGSLYVPYSVFHYASTGVDLGVDSSYIRSNNTLNLYSMKRMVVFDLSAGTCRNALTGEEVDVRCIMRNNRPYLPLAWVCEYFGLTYSYNTLPNISQGYLVRIKSDAAVLSDSKFIDAAGDLITRRLQEYNQSLNPPSETTPTPSTPTPSTPTPPSDPTNVTTYLAIRCAQWDGVAEILDALDQQNRFALFLLEPDMVDQQPDLLRRMLGSGHSVGISAQGDTPEATLALLEKGSQSLQALTYTRTTVALVPDEQQAAVEQAGWVCWDETLSLTPSASVGAVSFSTNTLKQLSGRTRTTYLTLQGGPNAARILPTLLRRLTGSNFILNVPMETKL